jgi:hypothetical protein
VKNLENIKVDDTEILRRNAPLDDTSCQQIYHSHYFYATDYTTNQRKNL